jgi:hypothetical protein
VDNDVKEFNAFVMKQQIPAIILDKEKNNFIVLILSDGAQSRFNFNLDCIQKTKLQQCCKVDFRIKKRVENLDFLPFSLLFIMFLRFGLLHWLVFYR